MKPLLFLSILAIPLAQAAPITWNDELIPIISVDSIDTTGTLVSAVNGGSDVDPITVTLSDNSVIEFTPFAILPNAASGTFYAEETDSFDLDDILDSHTWVPSAQVPVSFEISGLTAGINYQIQIIAAADSRACCSSRTQYYSDADEGGGNASVDLSRLGFYDDFDAADSVIGKFVADGPTQTIFVNGAIDPGISAYILRQEGTPEDSDNDGLADAWEMIHGIPIGPNNADDDPDFDAITNINEQANGTDPNVPDTVITWEAEAEEFATSDDIDTTGTLVAAINAGSAESATVGDITFTSAFPLSGNTGTNIDLYFGETDDENLDLVLDSHTFQNRGGVLLVPELIVGATYQIQIVAAADDRGCCATRTQSFQDTSGNASPSATRGDSENFLVESVTGTFVAYSFEVPINVVGATDPGLSAYILRQISDAEDTDSDGLSDIWEQMNGFPVAAGSNDGTGDPDGDSLDNSSEQARGTDPRERDSDGDLLDDNIESNTRIFVDATDTGTDPRNPDTDGDTILDKVESNTGTFVDAATDTGTNPLLVDTDGDTLPDNVETNTRMYVSTENTGTSPLLEDTDGDTFRDDDELLRGGDPNDGAIVPTVEIAIIGSLIGNDLTDPEEDFDDITDPDNPTNFNWVSIDASNEAQWNGEGAFNLFDNQIGPGDAKWCCNAPPSDITVEFETAVTLTKFTITSSNDTPGRDPLAFEIQGSNDGIDFATIYRRDSDISLWTARDQTVEISFVTPADPYIFIRYAATRTGNNTQHALTELEYFGVEDPVVTDDNFRITVIDYDPATSVFTVTFNSEVGKTYSINSSTDLIDFSTVAKGTLVATGESITTSFINPTPEAPTLFLRATETDAP